MIYTPEDKIDLIAELAARAMYYEKEIATYLEWKNGDMAGTKLVDTGIEIACRRKAIVQALIDKAWQL